MAQINQIFKAQNLRSVTSSKYVCDGIRGAMCTWHRTMGAQLCTPIQFSPPPQPHGGGGGPHGSGGPRCVCVLPKSVMKILNCRLDTWNMLLVPERKGWQNVSSCMELYVFDLLIPFMQYHQTRNIMPSHQTRNQNPTPSHQTRNRKENGWLRTPTNPLTDNKPARTQKENGWLRTPTNQTRNRQENERVRTPTNPPTSNEPTRLQKENGWLRTPDDQPRLRKNHGWLQHQRITREIEKKTDG